MFGIGGSEILVILVVALLFLGPEKLPDAAKQISKGIRDLRKQTRALQQTIEDDEHIGGAIRDLKSALRGEEVPVRPAVPIPPLSGETASTDVALPDDDAQSPHHDDDEHHAAMYDMTDDDMGSLHPEDETPGAEAQAPRPSGAETGSADSDSELLLIKPPTGETAARSEQPLATTARKHG